MKTTSLDEKSLDQRREPVGKQVRWMLLVWAGAVLAAAALVGFLFTQ